MMPASVIRRAPKLLFFQTVLFAAGLAIGGVNGYFGGYERGERHAFNAAGDLIAVPFQGECRALNPDVPGGRWVGKWKPAGDGRCHLRDFLR